MYTENETTLHLGVLGKRLGHSLSPEIHASLLKQQCIQGIYKKYEMDENEALHIRDVMKNGNIIGMNVTIPYKEVVYRLVDILDPHAEEIGAVNTIFMKNGIFFGYNTDYIGAISMFRKAGIELSGKSIVILGSGGAAKALIYGFHMEGALRITVAARNENTARHLKERFPYIQISPLTDIPPGDILINTTPVGMYPNIGESPLDSSVIRQFSAAADIVYNPLNTEFLCLAQKEGLQTVTGLMMLVDQAIGSEEIWLEKKLNYEMGDPIHNEIAKQF